MTKDEVLSFLESHANLQMKKIYLSHGAKEPLFGVKMSDIKQLKKQIKTDHQLAIELYNTRNSDAMVLAGLIADPNQVTVELLNDWIEKAYWDKLSDFCVAVLAAKSPYGFEVARDWIQRDEELIISAGYAVYCTLFSILPDDQINLNEVNTMLDEIGSHIHVKPLRIQNAMNNFVIMAGIYIKPIFDHALIIAKNIGKIQPLIAENDCNSQTATDYLLKHQEKGKIGVKIKNLNR